MVAVWAWLSPALVIVAALALIVLERRFPYTPGQRLLRDGLLTDLGAYALAQSYVMTLIIGAVLSAIDRSTGWSRLQILGGWPLGLQVVFFTVTHDLYIYLFHRWQHHCIWLWRLHEAHHSTREVDWLSGARSHALEIFINQTIEFAPIVLLGAAPEVVVIKGTLDVVWGMYIHSNLDVRPGWWSRVFVGPELHRWHHAIEITHGGVNFGTKLALWDWLLGTARVPGRHFPASAKPSGYGLPDVEFPRGYFAQHLFAFRPLHGAPATTSTPVTPSPPPAGTSAHLTSR